MLDALCKLLGIREDQAEDALKSERAARHALSRRSFFGAAGMLTTGTVFSFATPSAAAEIIVPERPFYGGVTGILFMPRFMGSGTVSIYGADSFGGLKSPTIKGLKGF